MEYKENAELCHCKHVTLADIDRALAQTNRFSDVEREFQEVQKITSWGDWIRFRHPGRNANAPPNIRMPAADCGTGLHQVGRAANTLEAQDGTGVRRFPQIYGLRLKREIR